MSLRVPAGRGRVGASRSVGAVVRGGRERDRYSREGGGTPPRESSKAKGCQGAESNRRHQHFQCCALPTELPWPGRLVAGVA